MGFIWKPHTRAAMVQETSVVFSIPLTAWKTVVDLTELPGAADGQNLGFDPGTFGTDAPILISTNEGGGPPSQEFARTLFTLPECYVAAQAVTFRISIKIDAVATTQRVDLKCYKSDRESGVGSDLCDTAVQIYTASWDDYDFTILPSGLLAGDVLDLRLENYISGNQTGDQIGRVGATEMLLSIKG